jgi:outer membrane protein W
VRAFDGGSESNKEEWSVLRKVLVGMAVLTLAASASRAQDHKAEIGVVGGWTFSDGVSGNAVKAGNGKIYDHIDPKDSFSFGLDVGFFVNENLQVGGLFSQQMSKMVLGGTDTLELGDWSVQNYHGTFTYNFGESAAKARPYVFGGLGATHFSTVDFKTAAGASLSTGGETQFSSTWGAGVKIYPGKNAGLKLGVRWTPTYIKSDAAGWWCDPYWGCYMVGNAQFSNQFEFSGGLTFRF